VRHLMAAVRVSQRRACAVVGQPRATQRQQPRPGRTRAAVARMLELVPPAPASGTAGSGAAGAEGWREPQAGPPAVAGQRAEVPGKTRKKRRLGSEARMGACGGGDGQGHVGAGTSSRTDASAGR